MTTTEKAVELYEKYLYSIPPFTEEGEIEHKLAIDCALILVDEILWNDCGSIGMDFAEKQELYIDEEFWKGVRKELLSL